MSKSTERQATVVLTLSTGRVLVGRPLGPNTEEIEPLDGGELTEGEWEEYCRIITRQPETRE